MLKPFYVYGRKSRSRKKNGKTTWYVRFRQKDGSMGVAVSSGQTNKGAAETWAHNYLREKGTPTPESGLTFGQFAQDWWSWGKCPYIKAKEARGFTISRGYAAARRSWLRRFVLPDFKHVKLSGITPAMVESWIMGLHEMGDLAPATLNRILGTLKVMLSEAVRLGYIPLNPASVVRELKEVPKERGILRIEEVKALFAPDALEKVWNGDIKHYAANMLAASTGLRVGEVQGLQRKYVFPTYVAVVHGWTAYGLSTPKWNSVRPVPIPSRVSDALQTVMENSPFVEPEHLVFWGTDGFHPLSNTAILGAFKRALVKIGISEEARKKRNIIFHSWRHGFNTLLRGKIADEQLRRVTGHKTLQLTDTYDHASVEHLEDVREEQELIFGESDEAE